MDDIFKKLEEQLQIIAEAMPELLKKELKKKGHYRTGNLDRSIDLLSYTMQNEGGKIQVNMESLFYIKYLEHGNFLPKFLEKQKDFIRKEIIESAKKDIIKDVKERYNLK